MFRKATANYFHRLHVSRSCKRPKLKKNVFMNSSFSKRYQEMEIFVASTNQHSAVKFIPK